MTGSGRSWTFAWQAPTAQVEVGSTSQIDGPRTRVLAKWASDQSRTSAHTARALAARGMA
jgi:hypothetical protein